MWCSNWWWGPGYFFGGPWGMMVNFLFWVLILGGLIYFFAWMMRRATVESPVRSESTRRGEGDMPLEILKRRYASGEISSEEFARMKKELL